MNKFLNLPTASRRYCGYLAKDYEVMRSSMIHSSAPTWAELIEQITILQDSVRDNRMLEDLENLES